MCFSSLSRGRRPVFAFIPSSSALLFAVPEIQVDGCSFPLLSGAKPPPRLFLPRPDFHRLPTATSSVTAPVGKTFAAQQLWRGLFFFPFPANLPVSPPLNCRIVFFRFAANLALLLFPAVVIARDQPLLSGGIPLLPPTPSPLLFHRIIICGALPS